MAKLNVTAIAEDTVAAPGNALNLYLIVSITDANGTGVPGLSMANFNIGSEIVGPGGSTSHIGAVGGGAVAGVYHLTLLPLAGQTWKSGVYIYSVTVAKGADLGQTLCSVLMD